MTAGGHLAGTPVVAAVLAAAAGWWAVAGPARIGGTRRRPPDRTVAVAVAVGLGPVAWMVVGVRHLALVAVAAGVATGASRLLLRARRARLADARAEAVLLACEGMAADLAAGQPPLAALRRAAAAWPELGPVATAGELDADVPQALRALADLPGAGQLRSVAAAWQVAHRTGAGLAGALARTAETLRDDRRTLRMVSTELAAARATARMMAALPALVLLFGVGLGGDPVGFLLHSPAGLGCLVSGLLLTYAGTAWLHRIADAVLAR
jgi:tight adherence protein B